MLIKEIDKKIIYLLNLNARMPLTSMAKVLHLSKDTVKYRINRLLSNKIIDTFYLDLEYKKLGFDEYAVFIRLKNTNEQDEIDILNKLCSINEIIYVASCSGNWDIFVILYANSIQSFDDTLNEITDVINKKLADYKTIINAQIYKKYKSLPEDYFINTKFEKKYLHKPNLNRIKIDKKDYQILKILEINSRMSLTNIANTTKLTIDVVRHRIKRMVKEGLIISFDIDLSHDKTGYYPHNILIKLQQYTKDKEKQLVYYLSSNKNVSLAIKVAGSQEILLEVITENIEQLNSFIKQLRNSFSDILLSYDIISIDKEFKDLTVPYIKF